MSVVRSFVWETNKDYKEVLEDQKRSRYPYLTTKRRTDLGTLVVPFVQPSSVTDIPLKFVAELVF